MSARINNSWLQWSGCWCWVIAQVAKWTRGLVCATRRLPVLLVLCSAHQRERVEINDIKSDWGGLRWSTLTVSWLGSCISARWFSVSESVIYSSVQTVDSKRHMGKKTFSIPRHKDIQISLHSFCLFLSPQILHYIRNRSVFWMLQQESKNEWRSEDKRSHGVSRHSIPLTSLKCCRLWKRSQSSLNTLPSFCSSTRKSKRGLSQCFFPIWDSKTVLECISDAAAGRWLDCCCWL